LIKEKIYIHYINEYRVYDEKVNSGNVFAKQRSRWISAQYQFLFKNFKTAIVCLFKGNFDYFFKTLQLALPPRLLLPGLLFLGSLFFYLIDSKTYFLSWSVLTFWVIFSYLIAIPQKFWNKQSLKVAISLPKAFLLTIKALFSITSANKTFIHTPHIGTEFNTKA